MYVMLLAFLGFSLISLTQAELIDVGVYRFLKLAEFVFLFFYVVSRVGAIGIRPIAAAFVASGVFQSALAILQFSKQSSLGLEILHESTLAVGMRGVAEISSSGLEFIRAYGTFPSPNILAGFLGICLFFAFYLFLRCWGSRNYFLAHSRSPSGDLRGSDCFAPPSAETMPKQSSNPPESNSDFPHIAMLARLRVFCYTITPTPSSLYCFAIFLLSFALLLAFSRGVIIFFVFTTILFFAGIFLLEKLKYYRKRAIKLACLVVASWLLVIVVAWPEVSSRFLESSASEPAIQERLFFNKVGVDTVSQNYSQLLFGVGIGNFVHHYMQSLPGLAPHLYQPVHNIFILIASEIGIFGLIAFIVFLASLFKKALQQFFTVHYPHDRENNITIFALSLVPCFLLFIALYDHYFWTLQQGALMFWIVLGLLAWSVHAYNKKL
jgi:hypothetical protein